MSFAAAVVLKPDLAAEPVMPAHSEVLLVFICCSTCKQVVELHPGVSINKEAVQQYAAQLDAAAVKAAGARGNVFPIKFESVEAEVGSSCTLVVSASLGAAAAQQVDPASCATDSVGFGQQHGT